jgi:Uma2 family endonuclease
MIQSILAALPPHLIYPESDGQPLADNTKQLRWIVVLYGNLAALFRDSADVFVAADLLWYPVEAEVQLRIAPDVLVAFGRPKGDRSSYRQWEEGGIPLTVVFEVLSPGNSANEMMNKHAFYEEHGVEEYYVFDPDNKSLHAFVRRGEILVRVRQLAPFTSPWLGIRFDLSGEEMVVYRPDGQRFLTFEEVQAAREQETKRADQAQQRADQAEQRAARLVELSRKVRRQQASAEELAELERLEGSDASSSP